MGRTGSGVEKRAASIRLHFVLDGVPCKKTLLTNGKPMPPTPANLKYAERLAAEIKERIRLGTFSLAEYFPASAGASSGEALTFGRQLDTWLESMRIEPSTRAGYLAASRFWKSAVVDGVALGSVPLRRLKLSDLLRGMATKPKLSGKTVNNYVSVAREALALAVSDGMLAINPADGVPRASHQKDPPDPFSLDEVEAILGYMASHHPEPVFNMVEWRLFSGVRTSEAAGLRWTSIDHRYLSFRVESAIVRGLEKDKTKTAVVRDVIMNSRAKAAMQRQAKHTRVSGGFVWLDPRYGTPWLEERAFRRSYWTPCLKALGIRYRPPNQMRHTYASMMLMAKRAPAWCAGQMGHSIDMFLRTYARWIKGEQDKRELDGFEEWLAAGKTESRKAV